MSKTSNPFHGIKHEFRCVSSTYASTLLKQNTLNRTLRPAVVTRYALDMKSGDWKFCESAIVVAPDGTILNGQHRLHAVVVSGCAQWFTVIRNIPKEAIFDLDQGLVRSVPDSMNLSGRSNGWHVTNRSIATARYMRGRILRTTTTRSIITNYANKHRDAILFADKAFGSVGVRGVTGSSIMACVARAAESGEDRGRLSEFATVMRTGESNGPKDSAAIKLRNWLINPERPGDVDVAYRKMQRALQAFLKGEKLTKLFESPKELWPLTDDAR